MEQLQTLLGKNKQAQKTNITLPSGGDLNEDAIECNSQEILQNKDIQTNIRQKQESFIQQSKPLVIKPQQSQLQAQQDGSFYFENGSIQRLVLKKITIENTDLLQQNYQIGQQIIASYNTNQKNIFRYNNCYIEKTQILFVSPYIQPITDYLQQQENNRLSETVSIQLLDQLITGLKEIQDMISIVYKGYPLTQSLYITIDDILFNGTKIYISNYLKLFYIEETYMQNIDNKDQAIEKPVKTNLHKLALDLIFTSLFGITLNTNNAFIKVPFKSEISQNTYNFMQKCLKHYINQKNDFDILQADLKELNESILRSSDSSVTKINDQLPISDNDPIFLQFFPNQKEMFNRIKNDYHKDFSLIQTLLYLFTDDKLKEKNLTNEKYTFQQFEEFIKDYLFELKYDSPLLRKPKPIAIPQYLISNIFNVLTPTQSFYQDAQDNKDKDKDKESKMNLSDPKSEQVFKYKKSQNNLCDMDLFKQIMEKFDFSDNLEEFNCLLLLKHVKQTQDQQNSSFFNSSDYKALQAISICNFQEYIESLKLKCAKEHIVKLFFFVQKLLQRGSLNYQIGDDHISKIDFQKLMINNNQNKIDISFLMNKHYLVQKIQNYKDSMKDKLQIMSQKDYFKRENQKKNKFKKNFQNSILLIILLGVSYVTCYFSMGDQFLPFNEVFSLLFLWVCSSIVGKIFEFVKLPPLLGMLLTGLVFRQIIIDEDRDKDILSELPDSWSSKIRNLSLCIIMVRSGLGINMQKLKKAGFTAFRLAAFPCVFEAFTIALVSLYIFYDTDLAQSDEFLLACILGFVMSAISPAVVVSAMFQLQNQGYGAQKAIPSMVIASASIDDVVSIIGYSIFLGVGLPISGSLFLDIISGPLSCVCGVVSGIILGSILGCTTIFDTMESRTMGTFVFAAFTMFMYNYISGINLSAAGAIGSLVLGVVISKCWKEGKPNIFNLSLGQKANYVSQVQTQLNTLWVYICQPLLFPLIGASVKFRDLDSDIIPKCIAIVCIGTFVRVIVCFLSIGSSFTLKERLLISLSWIPKATVQAALAGVPLDLIKDKMDKDQENYDLYEKWGNNILTTAIFAIIITAPIGLLLINGLGPKLLTKDEQDDQTKVRKKSILKKNSGNNKAIDQEEFKILQNFRQLKLKYSEQQFNPDQRKSQQIDHNLLYLSTIIERQNQKQKRNYKILTEKQFIEQIRFLEMEEDIFKQFLKDFIYNDDDRHYIFNMYKTKNDTVQARAFYTSLI